MCLSPLHIGNPSRRFRQGYMARYIDVPCNSCPDCQSRQQDDWYIRAFFEYRRCQMLGGATWFPTLTYNDEHLPIWNDVEHGFTCPCFSYDDIKSFRSKLRVYLFRWFLHCAKKAYFMNHPECSKKDKNGVEIGSIPRDQLSEIKKACRKKATGIRFIICSEFGGKKGRPHYHCLLFVPFAISFAVMNKILNKAWTNGFVSWARNKDQITNGIFRPTIESSRGIKYVMKYISKDDSWYEKYGLDDYKWFLKDVDSELYKDFMKHRPRHFQSTYFGIDGLDTFKIDGNFSFDLVKDGRMSVMKFGALAPKDGYEWNFHIPAYYERKMMYDYDKSDELYSLNSFGRSILRYRFDRKLKTVTDILDGYLRSEEDFVHSTFGVDIFQHLGKFSPLAVFNDKREVYRHLVSVMNGRTIPQLAIYSTVYRYLEPTDDMYEADRLNTPAEMRVKRGQFLASTNKAYYWLRSLLPDPNNEPFQRFDDVDSQLRFFCSPEAVELVLRRRLSVGDFEPAPKKEAPIRSDRSFFKRRFTYGDFEAFQGFDYVLTCLDEITSIVGLMQKEVKRQEHERVQSIASRFNVSLYNHV